MDQRREDGDHKVSLKILVDLKRERGNLSGADVTRRGLDMRVWWTEGTWRPILVLQFNFQVMMHFFRLCKLKDGDVWLTSFDVFTIAKLNQIETLLGDYITDIERTKDYKKKYQTVAGGCWTTDWNTSY